MNRAFDVVLPKRQETLDFFVLCTAKYGMFSVIIQARSHPMALAATLGPLVRGVVEGLVGSATLVSSHDAADIREIADSAGCRVLVAASWAEGFARTVANTAGAPLLVVDNGVLLGQEFWPILADHLPLLGDQPAATRAAKPTSTLARIFGASQGVVSPDQVLLLPGSVSRVIAQAKMDPWQFRFGDRLVILPAETRRVQE
ncbi:hypothetical protein MCEMSEM23_00179 [Rhabdaerophilaceae bacterium]